MRNVRKWNEISSRTDIIPYYLFKVDISCIVTAIKNKWMVYFCLTQLKFKDIYTLEKDNFADLAPFLHSVLEMG